MYPSLFSRLYCKLSSRCAVPHSTGERKQAVAVNCNGRIRFGAEAGQEGPSRAYRAVRLLEGPDVESIKNPGLTSARDAGLSCKLGQVPTREIAPSSPRGSAPPRIGGAEEYAGLPTEPIASSRPRWFAHPAAADRRLGPRIVLSAA